MSGIFSPIMPKLSSVGPHVSVSVSTLSLDGLPADKRDIWAKSTLLFYNGPVRSSLSSVGRSISNAWIITSPNGPTFMCPAHQITATTRMAA